MRVVWWRVGDMGGRVWVDGVAFTSLRLLWEEGFILSKWKVVILAMLCCAVWAGTSAAAEQTGVWGVGAFASHNMPLKGLKSWFSNAGKYGMTFNYVPASRIVVEVEYHRSRFDRGKLSEMPFLWPVDGQEHQSVGATSTMSLDSGLLSILVHRANDPAFRAWGTSPYIAVGMGFYRYETDNRNFAYPAQISPPFDPTKVLEPFSDRRFGLAFSLGTGVQAFITDNWALDLRGRYSVVIGELRPMELWGVRRTFPIQLVDLTAGLKFYFKR